MVMNGTSRAVVRDMGSLPGSVPVGSRRNWVGKVLQHQHN